MSIISLKKYMDASSAAPQAEEPAVAAGELMPAFQSAYRSALREMGSTSLIVCPAQGSGLKQALSGLEEKLASASPADVAQAEVEVREQLRGWGLSASRNMKEKADEVKALLLTLARTGESLAHRDERCAEQIGTVTTHLKKIATLDDLSQIRTSIEKSAQELKASIDRMTAEGKQAVEQLRVEVSNYRSRMEAAEYVAAFDGVTGLGSRLWVESQIEARVERDATFCVMLLDIDNFKSVNDTHGHLVGDQVLKQFGGELKSVCRSGDVLGRWGGDEFIVVLDCDRDGAETQVARVRKWVCGDYTLQVSGRPVKKEILASIGVAERRRGESMSDLIQRADTAMYAEKGGGRRRASA